MSDPNETLRQLVEALAEDARADALDAMEKLQAWLDSGGFLPTTEARRLLNASRHQHPASA